MSQQSRISIPSKEIYTSKERSLSKDTTSSILGKNISISRSPKPSLFGLDKRKCIKILKDNIDRTPKSLISDIYMPIENTQLNALSFISGESTTRLGSTTTINVTDFISKTSEDDAYKSKQTGASASQIVGQSMIITQAIYTSQIDAVEKPERTTDEIDEGSSIPSGYFMPMVPYVRPKVTATVQVVLNETPTFFLFDRPNTTAELGSEEAELVEQDNQYYEYVTVGKGRFRKISSTEVQTMDLIKKTRMAMAWRVKRTSKSTFVSDWVMYDAEKEQESLEQKEFSEDEVDYNDPEVTQEEPGESKSEVIARKESMLSPDEQFEKIAETEAFLDACSKMERLLASNVYREQQKIFRGLMQQDPLRMDVAFKYTANLLWSFKSDYVLGRTVTGMCWNTQNTDLIAIGYGKYFYQERKNGLVCCWTIKNPTQPERKYLFKTPVTAVSFSKDCPNLLACGFYDGSVIILDISSREKSIIAQSNRESSPSYEPVWQLYWFHGEDYHVLDEQLMTCCQDGRISRYRREKLLNCFPMMRVNRMEGKVKGIDQPRKCKAHEISVSRNPAALVLTRHPGDPLLYYVGTDEGCVHKCSMNYLHHHMDIFLAHKGPVYALQFSPFCSKIFLTCGADWCVRIWCDGIGEPLIVLRTNMQTVLGASWSPTNSTVIASISGNCIHFWDLTRKIFVPASTTESPTNAKNLVVEFTTSGLNLVVGDGNGAVHVYGLEDMPFSPYYQLDALVDAIKKALVTRPNVLKALRKIGKPFK
ncbi:hypothetical protein C0J52_02396 [Blattella germanica]|nr:hypothetical protein C0J52_02396 [Blattella germanica]